MSPKSFWVETSVPKTTLFRRECWNKGLTSLTNNTLMGLWAKGICCKSEFFLSFPLLPDSRKWAAKLHHTHNHDAQCTVHRPGTNWGKLPWAATSRMSFLLSFSGDLFWTSLDWHNCATEMINFWAVWSHTNGGRNDYSVSLLLDD